MPTVWSLYLSMYKGKLMEIPKAMMKAQLSLYNLSILMPSVWSLHLSMYQGK